MHRPTCFLRLFGRFEITVSGKTVAADIVGKDLQVLAHLALDLGQLQSREAVAEQIWPDADPDRSRQRLRQALSNLRKAFSALGEDPDQVFLAEGKRLVGLSAERIATDVQEFLARVKGSRRASSDAERQSLLRKALSHYRGPFLLGEEDGWVLDRRAMLEDLFLASLKSLQACPTDRMEQILLAHETLKRDPFNDSALDTIAGAIEEIEKDRTTSAPRIVAVPHMVDRFLGRDQELELLTQLVQGGRRLITLVGAGGVGKTRLSVEFAHHYAKSLAASPSEPWHFLFVQCAEEHTWEGVKQAITALVRQVTEDPSTDVGEFLRSNRTLLVLDNLEQILPNPAEPVEDLLREHGSLTVLCTSRKSLGARGETVLDLGAMPLPPVDVDLETLKHSAAMSLFADRVLEVRPRFVWKEEDWEAAANIVRSLDGHPLAIELVAKEVRLRNLQEIVREILPARDRVLEPIGRAVLSTVTALPSRTKDGLAQVGRIIGKFDASEAEQVMAIKGDAPSVLDDALRSGMLVRLEDRDATRYRMVGVIRQTLEDLNLLDDSAEAKEAYALWMTGVAREMTRLVEAERPADALATGRRLLDDLKQAYALVTEIGKWEEAIEIALAVGRTHLLIGLAQPGAVWCQDAKEQLDAEASTLLEKGRGIAFLDLTGALCATAGMPVPARAIFERTVAIREAIGDPVGIGRSNGNLGIFLCDVGEPAAAYKHFQRALEVSNELPAQINRLVRLNFATCLTALRRLPEALELNRALEAEFAALGNQRNLAIVQCNTADSLLKSGEREASFAALKAPFTYAIETGEWSHLSVILDTLTSLLTPDSPERAWQAHSLANRVNAGLRRSRKPLVIADLEDDLRTLNQTLPAAAREEIESRVRAGETAERVLEFFQLLYPAG
jgi:DNA-binding SARP family transcriptional activator